MDTHLHLRAGSTAQGPYDTVVDPGERDGWEHTGLRVLALPAGGRAELGTGRTEIMVVPLGGACTVTVSDARGVQELELRGREDVFAGATDVAYVGIDSHLVVASEQGGRFALAMAVATHPYPATRIAAEDVPVEVRGGGRMTRLVRNFGAVGAFDAMDSLIACEVVTPGGNWSSYPAHKHDETTDSESELEEIYYYEIQPAPAGTPGFGYHQTTASSPDRPIDVLAEVRAGDTVLVPHGWHGPCAAAPGHDMYYLNVMAGPSPDRAWNITDHPDQTWVRGTWDEAGIDPRLEGEAR